MHVCVCVKCDVLYKPTRSQCYRLGFVTTVYSLNAKQHGAESAMAKAISGHSASKSGMAMEIVCGR